MCSYNPTNFHVLLMRLENWSWHGSQIWSSSQYHYESWLRNKRSMLFELVESDREISEGSLDRKVMQVVYKYGIFYLTSLSLMERNWLNWLLKPINSLILIIPGSWMRWIGWVSLETRVAPMAYMTKQNKWSTMLEWVHKTRVLEN